MATHLDLQEQEQLDAVKSFWKRYGNLITWLLIAVLGGFAAWNGYTWWQRDQGAKASAMFDELDRAAMAGDAARATQAFNDIRDRYPRTIYAQKAGLLAGRVQHEKGQADAAAASLTWVVDNAIEPEFQTIARLRLAGILLEQKKPDDALKLLDAATQPAFAALVADRRGDVLLSQDKKDDAKAAYQAAWKAMDEKVEYRRLIEAKLTSLGAAPEPAASAPAAGAKP